MKRINFDGYERIEIIGESPIAGIIQRVVCSLPNVIRKWVTDNITFIDFAGLEGLACEIDTRFPSKKRNKNGKRQVRLLVIVGFPVHGQTMESLIAHEIAHHWCGHKEKLTPDEYEKQENEADALAKKWGFPGKSGRMIHRKE